MTHDVTDGGMPAELQETAKPRRLLWLVLAVAAVVIALDQFTKWIVVTFMKPGQSIDFIGTWVRWEYVQNPGAAFSFGLSFTWVFTILAVIVAIVIIRSSRRLGSVLWAIGLGGVLGGALGNLIDRLIRPPGFGRGYVVDFVALPHFAVFNVADMAITCSAVLLAILAFRGVPFTGVRSNG